MIELLAGALTGSGCCGPGPRTLANGMLSIYLRPGAFADGAAGDAGAFAAEVESYVAFITSARPAEPDGEVLLPGQPEQRNRERRRAEGIALEAETLAALIEAAETLALPAETIEACLAARA